MRIVLLGPPGSGKTTISDRIGEHCAVPVITCNGILERAAAEDSELGRLAKEAMNTNRVSDELLLALLRVRLSQKELAGGFVLVDFPRNVGQADVVDGILDTLGRPIDLVLFISVDGDELMERLVGRIACDHCGAKYNLYTKPPLVEGICDHCGARVNRRPDDYEETISNRLRIYDGLMGPLQQYYSLHGKLRKVEGNEGSDEVWRVLKNIIDATPRTVIETEPVSEPAVSIKDHKVEEADKASASPVRNDTPIAEKKAKAKSKIATANAATTARREAHAKKTRSKKAVEEKKVAKKSTADIEKPKSGVASVKKNTAAAKKTVAKKRAALERSGKKIVSTKRPSVRADAKKTTRKKTATKSVVKKVAQSKSKIAVKKKASKPSAKRKKPAQSAKSKQVASRKKKPKKAD